MRGAMLRQTCVVCGWPERESTNSWKRMSASTEPEQLAFARAASAIVQTSFASSAKSASSICSSAFGEAEALEREADRDQHLLDLLLGDAEHDGAAVRVRDDEALVLELAQRLAHGAAARLQLARDPLLDQPLAVGEAADRDRLAQVVDDLLAPRTALLAARRGRGVAVRATAGRAGSTCTDSDCCVKAIVDNLQMVDNPPERALAYTRPCGSPTSRPPRSVCRCASR